MRIAVVNKDKCRPNLCARECVKCCPVNKKGEECIVLPDGKKAFIDEKLCIGCGICIKRCPFGAIDIINVPGVEEKDMIHRFGVNGFAVYGLPLPKENAVLGLLGRNGIGKSTAVQILAGKLEPNFGKVFDEKEKLSLQDFYKGTEYGKYFDSLKEDMKVAYKPQNLSSLTVDLTVSELLEKTSEGDKKKVEELSKELKIDHLLKNKLNKLSGGELQKVAIIAACLKEADIYFFDEPLAYLDISERLRVSDFIKKIAQGKTVIVVEHDLLILDYLTEYLNIFFGKQGTFGLISGIKSSTNGVNSYLSGFLREDNLRIRETELSFNFNKNAMQAGKEVSSWPSFKKKFDSFELEIKEGKINENHVIGILGKNGTGKTTFVKCLVGLEEVELENGEIKKLDLDIDISYKPQYLFTDSEEMVRDVVVKEKIAKNISNQFSLEVLMHKKIKDLSGGELQRFSIARCLAREADVYLIDEPSAYLDVEERISCAKAIKDLMIEKGKTAFVVDHDLLLVSYLADSVIVFDGEGGKEGKSSQVYSFEEGVSHLLKKLDITLRKDKDSGRPRINKKDSVLDREQKAKGKWVDF